MPNILLPDMFLALFTVARQVIFAYLYYYTFRSNLRISLNHLILIYIISIGLEIVIQYHHGPHMSLGILFLTPFCYCLYALAFVKEQLKKKLFIILLFAHVGMLTITFSLVCEEQLGLTPNMASSLINTGLLLLFIPLYHVFLKKYQQLFHTTKANKALLIANYILFFNFIGLTLTRDFTQDRGWALFWARVFNTIPAILFLLLLFYLMDTITKNEKMDNRIKILEGIRQSEKHYFNFIIERWQSSRNIRHDLRHHALLISNYLHTKEYAKLNEYLQGFIRTTEIQQRVTLSGHEIIDGVVGYWQSYCWENEFDCETDIKIEKIFIDDIDLAIVLGNALENAATATKSCYLSQRTVKVKLTTKNNMLLISISNPHSGNLVYEEDNFYSEKRNFLELGHGIENIKHIAQKYQGYVKIKPEANSFTINIALKNIHIPQD